MGRLRLRAEEGQTSAEYLGVIVVVGVIIAALVAASPGIASTISEAIEAALCRIVGERCDAGTGAAAHTWEPRQPCVSRRTGGSGSLSASVTVVDVGMEKGFLVEERSDGDIAVTMYDTDEIGLSKSEAADVKIALGQRKFEAGAQAGVGTAVTTRQGVTTVFDDRKEADRFVKDQLVTKGLDALPPGVRHLAKATRWFIDRATGHTTPEGRQESTQSRVGFKVHGEASAGAVSADAEVEAALQGAVERKVDSATGETTYAFEVGEEGSLDAFALMQGFSSRDGMTLNELGARGAATSTAELRVDKRGHPVSLKIGSTLTGGFDAPQRTAYGSASDLLEEVGSSVEDGKKTSTVQTEFELDITDPANRAPALEFLGAIGRADSPAAARSAWRLGDRLMNHSVTTVTAYDNRDREYGVSVQGKLEVGVGAGAKVATTDSRLTGAWYRDPTTGRMVPWHACTG